MEKKERHIQQWNYDDLDNDIEELNRNLLNLGQQQIIEARKTLDSLNVPKEKKSHNILKKIFKS